MKPKTEKSQIYKPSEKEPDTDLSQPLIIYDQAAFDAAIHTIVSILLFDSLEPMVAKTTEKESH
jgi:hypothetical protein